MATNMLWRLIKKEVLEHLMSLRFAIACVLCLVVVLGSLFVRSADYLMVRDDHDLQVFMARRHYQIDFASGAMVFPGGKASDDDERSSVTEEFV